VCVNAYVCVRARSHTRLVLARACGHKSVPVCQWKGIFDTPIYFCALAYCSNLSRDERGCAKKRRGAGRQEGEGQQGVREDAKERNVNVEENDTHDNICPSAPVAAKHAIGRSNSVREHSCTRAAQTHLADLKASAIPFAATSRVRDSCSPPDKPGNDFRERT
jgi:hypothetical protein